jgi:hypothetical protein
MNGLNHLNNSQRCTAPVLCNKANYVHYFINLFCHKNLHVSESLSVYDQEFIHCLQTGMTYTIVECAVNKLLKIGRAHV